MDKLKMQTGNIVDENIEFIGRKFPNCIVEAKDASGKITKMVDFDLLKQELSKVVVDGDKERYTMNWPDKKKAILTANAPILKTLRAEKTLSKDFDKTKNVYIEGDNLDVLKILRETYLGKIDVIYIDPPYNTGSDFLYEDDFAIDMKEYMQRSNQIDENGNKMVYNSADNGQFHTDWLNMIYPRIRIAKDLLSENGIIFISIDDNELYNLKKICDEVFGNSNFIANFIRKTSFGEKTAKPNINKHHDYVVCYAKQIQNIQALDVLNGELKEFGNFSNPDNDPNGDWTKDSLLIKIDNGRFGYARYPITNPYLNITHYPPVYHDETNRKQWHYIESTFREMEKRGQVVYYKDRSEYTGEYSFYIKKYKKDIGKIYNNISTLFATDNEFTNANGTLDIMEVFDKKEFENSYPKPIELIKKLIKYATYNNKEAYIMDFFSGSGTTAQAIMELNAQDGGKRKFILVQLPEECGEKSKYKTICELGEERIRRAGQKIIEKQASLNNAYKQTKLEPMKAYAEFTTSQKAIEEQNNVRKWLDVGFRVFKLDSSNMKDTYYKPADYSLNLLDQLDENIKSDRTPEDLLFQVMLDLGLVLDSKIEEKNINGKKVFVVGEYNDYVSPDLICCFDSNVDNNTVTEIAKMKPRFSVFRDSSMSRDSVAVNFDQIFETYSPSTTRKVL